MKTIKNKSIIFAAIIVFLLSHFLHYQVKPTRAADVAIPAPCHEPQYDPEHYHWLVTQTWTKAGSPYCMDYVSMPTNNTLTIEPGTVIKFSSPASGLVVDGKLYALGTEAEPIVFTSMRDDQYMGDTNGDGIATSPAPGDWRDLVLSNDQETKLDHVIIQYGGEGQRAMVNAGHAGNLTITNSTIAHSVYDGVGVVDASKWYFHYNKIFDNNGWGVDNYESEWYPSIDVRNNWWGSDDGPSVTHVRQSPDPNAEEIRGCANLSQIFYEPWLKIADLNNTPDWRRDIQPGDILYDPYSSGVGHIGLYVGNGKTVEAQGRTFWQTGYPGKVNEDPITSWDYPDRQNVYLLRVKKPTSLTAQEWNAKKQATIEFVYKQINKPYDWKWIQKQRAIDSPSWYCSELVWAAYLNQGIDLEYYHDPDGVISPVSPVEISLDDDVYAINGHHENTDPGWEQKTSQLLIMSPVYVEIIDSLGNKVNKDVMEIPGVAYLVDDIDGSGHAFDRIILPDGYYTITVTPKPGAGLDETYSLAVEQNGQRTYLAQNVKISNIPTKPYVIRPYGQNFVPRPGDVVINEIMWAGSSKSIFDQWLELKNTSDQDIDLNGWHLANVLLGKKPLTLSGTIPAHGFYLISNLSQKQSAVNVGPNLVNNWLFMLELYRLNGIVSLTDNQNVVIDATPAIAKTTLFWPAGRLDFRHNWSMERNLIPGDGKLNPSWHTCNRDSLTPANLTLMNSYWDAGLKPYNCGTPGAENL